MANTYLFPEGNADVQSPASAAAYSLPVANTNTIIQLAPAVAGTLDLLPSSELKAGSKVMVDVDQGATGRNITFGSTGSTIVAPNLTGVANDRDVIELVWTGSEFVALGAWFKVVDAA